MKSILVKSLAVASSIALAAGLICYQSGILPLWNTPANGAPTPNAVVPNSGPTASQVLSNVAVDPRSHAILVSSNTSIPSLFNPSDNAPSVIEPHNPGGISADSDIFSSAPRTASGNLLSQGDLHTSATNVLPVQVPVRTFMASSKTMVFSTAQPQPPTVIMNDRTPGPISYHPQLPSTSYAQAVEPAPATIVLMPEEKEPYVKTEDAAHPGGN